MAKRGKRIRDARKEAAAQGAVPLDAAVSFIKDNAKAKFDETVDVAVNLGIDARKSEQSVRGTCRLPGGTGKTMRVAVFATGPKADEAKAAGADIVGAEDLVEQVQGGTIEFDRCIATPDMMAQVSKVARVLGPRGLMPNPKVGTVTADVAAAVGNAKGGEIQFRTERAGVIHAGIGRASFEAGAIADNVRALVAEIRRVKPAGVKGTFLRKVTLSTTMGPGVEVDVASIGD